MLSILSNQIVKFLCLYLHFEWLVDVCALDVEAQPRCTDYYNVLVRGVFEVFGLALVSLFERVPYDTSLCNVVGSKFGLYCVVYQEC